jgi:hypothetical protein
MSGCPSFALVSAVIGGTISKVTGGKFINGAASAAFAAALRADWGQTKERPAHYDRALTKEEIDDAKANFDKVKKEVISDYKKGVFKEHGVLDSSPDGIDGVNIVFKEKLLKDGRYIAGDVSVQDKTSYVEIGDMNISAHGCITMSECYTTFGHELGHTSLKNMTLTPGWGVQMEVHKPYNIRVYQEDHAESLGLWYAKRKGY